MKNLESRQDDMVERWMLKKYPKAPRLRKKRVYQKTWRVQLFVRDTWVKGEGLLTNEEIAERIVDSLDLPIGMELVHLSVKEKSKI